MMLMLIKMAHLAVYFVMVSAVFYTLYCGITGQTGLALYVAISLVLTEGAVLMANRWKCPMTELAKEYGAKKGFVFESLLSERAARWTLPVYATVFVIGLILLAIELIS